MFQSKKTEICTAVVCSNNDGTRRQQGNNYIAVGWMGQKAEVLYAGKNVVCFISVVLI